MLTEPLASNRHPVIFCDIKSYWPDFWLSELKRVLSNNNACTHQKNNLVAEASSTYKTQQTDTENKIKYEHITVQPVNFTI